MSETELPKTKTVLSRIRQLPRRDFEIACLFDFSICGRISEVVGKSYSSDKRTLARGPVGEECIQDRILLEIGGEKFWRDAVVFIVHTAKRKKRTSIEYSRGLIRKVALPLEEDPIAEILLDYFSQFGPRDYVFPFTRQEISRYLKEKHETFKGLKCPIDEYKIMAEGEIFQVPAHDRPYSLSSLRHQKASDLINFYGFDGFNLAAYGGWSIKPQIRVTSTMTRYLYINWQAYFHKLLRKPVYASLF
jgi:hypothetical protein